MSTAAVGLGVPLINSGLEKRRFRLQSDESRIEEVRVVLDAAAQSVLETLAPLGDLMDAAADDPPKDRTFWSEQARSDLDRFGKAIGEVARQERRLAVRLGRENAVAVAIGRVGSALATLNAALEAARIDDRPPDADSLRRERDELFSEERGFHNEAAALLGVPLAR